MTNEELRAKIKEIVDGYHKEKYASQLKHRDQLYALFDQHREQIFQVSERLPEHWEVEVELTKPEKCEWSDATWNWRDYLRQEGLAFITCSCGSREDSCSEDGEGNFSKFFFTPDGSVFRSVEKKS